MRILQITNRVPYPPKDGGAIGYYNFTKSYFMHHCSLTLLAMNTSKHYIDISKLPDDFTCFAKIHAVNVDTKVKPFNAFINLFSGKSYNTSRFENKNFRNKLIEILINNTFDIIHLDSLFVSMYIETIRMYSEAKIVMRAHNVEHLIWERIADNECKPLKKWYFSLLAKKLKTYEKERINKVDLLLPISEIDKKYFAGLGCNTKQYVIPAGIHVDNVISDNSMLEYPSLFHLGSLDWIPNLQALKWFIDEIWPLVNDKFPGLNFYIAGKNTPKWLMEINSPGIIVSGEVENATDFMNRKAIMVVPLLSGSGMRLKIIEGMALGKTIISTSVGAEGIEYTRDKEIIIADTPQEFLSAIEKCMNDKKYFEEIGQNAQQLSHLKYDNFKLVGRLLDFYKTIM